MANVLLIGATGFVGSAVLNELVERGHKVTAVVRNVEKIAKNDLVTAVKEDVANVVHQCIEIEVAKRTNTTHNLCRDST